jgi:mannobiose 2-epimerase
MCPILVHGERKPMSAFEPEHHQRFYMARHAYDYLRRVFWDATCGGVYWSVDALGHPHNDRKHIYAQAFAIYGLAEYYCAIGDPEALKLAQTSFRLIEAHSFDPIHGGNIECLSREWGSLADMRLSEKDLNSRKSMNTLLHLMEAYTRLLQVWDDATLRAKLRALIGLFLHEIIDPNTHHLKLFFDDAWNSLLSAVSFGHDIEGSWLLVEAATILGDADLAHVTRRIAVEMAEAVYVEGRDTDGSVFYEAHLDDPKSTDKHWWVQAEAVVGFYAAYQLSGRAEFAEASRRLWEYIEARFVDRTYGDWFRVLDRAGKPYPDQVKVGPWECPYHHSRVCFEMLTRLASSAA